MKSNTMLLLLAAGVAYYFYTKSSPAAQMTCRYPDGTVVTLPQGNACPFDNAHGGQSVRCYPIDFTGPLPAGAVPCS